MTRPMILTTLFLAVALWSGCSSLLPSGQDTIDSPLSTFEEARQAYDSIVPYQTSREDLQALGLDPYVNPNVVILSFVDVQNTFIPTNANIKVDDLPRGVQDCIRAKERCQAYEIQLGRRNTEAEGNVVLDLLHFTQHRTTRGWTFKPFVVLVDHQVVYKVWSGMPDVSEKRRRTYPLGPLQDPIGILFF